MKTKINNIINPFSPVVLDTGIYPEKGEGGWRGKGRAGGVVLRTRNYILAFCSFFITPGINVEPNKE